MNILWYNVIIWGLIGLVTFLGILILFYEALSTFLLASIAILVSLILFIISLKMDKISSVRMLIFLDDNKRKILDALKEEMTFEELHKYSNLTGYKSRLHENIQQMKEVGLIYENTEFVRKDSELKRIKIFSRSF